MANQVTYELDCAMCGEPVRLGGPSLLKHVRAGTQPLCRVNGCFRYGYERSGGGESTGTARKSQGVVVTHVAGNVFVPGRGERGHQRAPLANGRVRRCGIRG